MAEIWLARHRGAGGVEKRLVVKRILQERTRDPRFLDLFVSEAKISMALTHKNIVPTFDFGRVGDELFLVMEYIEGTNLALAMGEAKRRSLPPSAPLVCHIAFEVCQALEYAHGYNDDDGVARRIAHRDVTPANLLLSEAGEVKLSDFGLAQVTEEDAEAEGRTRGTPRYMAPEQALGGVVGPAADIFSLGLVLRDCLLFDVLRKGSQDEQLRAAKLPVPPLSKNISEDMRAICERATQFDPGDRYPSAKAMSEDLDRALLNARMAETNDRRPMPERLAAWVASVRVPEDAETFTSSVPIGAAATFLDEGDNVMAGLGDATMRSMASTGLEGTSDTAPANESERGSVPRSPEPRPARTRSRSWLAISVLLLAPLGGLVFYLTRSAPPELLSKNALEEQPKIFDAGLPDSTTIREADARGALDASTARDAGRVTRRKKVRQPLASMGTLRVSTAPWATVSVLGRSESCAETPCQLQLPIGAHTLTLRNPVAGLRKVISVVVKKDRVVKVHEVLEPPLR